MRLVTQVFDEAMHVWHGHTERRARLRNHILFDHNGGWFDRLFYNIAYLNQVMPYITLYGVFNASSSYGTEKQVNSNT